MSAQPAENQNALVLEQFRLYAEELDDKHDRHERIVKLSRDITIESKRIIFLLHTIDNESKKSKVLKEAEKRLKALCSKQFKSIALELLKQDPYLYLKAYTAGLQEFIEALTFYQYIEDGKINHWKDIQQLLSYKISELNQNTKHSKADTVLKLNETDCEKESSQKDDEVVCTFVPPPEYLLGLGDLTGEVMRKCILCVGTGDTEGSFKACKFLQEMHTGFVSITQNGIHREIYRKANTLRQSVLKAEKVCYNIKVRGNECSNWALIDTANERLEEDEGFC